MFCVALQGVNHLMSLRVMNWHLMVEKDWSFKRGGIFMHATGNDLVDMLDFGSVALGDCWKYMNLFGDILELKKFLSGKEDLDMEKRIMINLFHFQDLIR